jgi:hypothetical protein
MTLKTKAIMGVGLVAGLGAVMLPLASYASSDTQNMDVRVRISEDISITEVTNTALNLAISGANQAAGTPATGSHTVDVLTTNATGYTVSMYASAATLNLDAGGNVFTGAIGFNPVAGAVIGAPAAGTYSEATVTSGVVLNAASLITGAQGLWGFQMTGWTGYAAVPAGAGNAVVIAQSNTSSINTSSGDPTVINFAAQAGTQTGAGVYGTTITYIAASK